jgi:hypothetical protein
VGLRSAERKWSDARGTNLALLLDDLVRVLHKGL